jgi:Leucine-rich repeat (LRR) protein
MLQVSKFLRVVKLQGIDFGEKLPATIGNAVHLQYLGVTGCSLKWIPSAVGKLKHLQALDVQDTYVQELPQAFWRIRALRHVLGTSIYLPKRVGNLKHLHTLVKVLPNPNHNCWDSKTFERMLRLQSLNIVDSSKDAENLNELFAAIEKPNILEYLQTLVLQANKFPMCIFTSSSQRRLRALELYGKLDMTMLSSEKGKEETNICLPNLTTLSLEDTEVTQDFMNYLANFPLLANLTLKQNSYKNAKRKLLFNSGGYKCLTKMKLCDLEDLEVQIMKSGLPVLTDLVILQSTQTQLTQVKLVVYGKHEFLKTLQHEKIELHAEAP